MDFKKFVKSSSVKMSKRIWEHAKTINLKLISIEKIDVENDSGEELKITNGQRFKITIHGKDKEEKETFVSFIDTDIVDYHLVLMACEIFTAYKELYK